VDVQLVEEDRKKLIELMSSLVTNNGGEVISHLDLGQRTLAYLVKKRSVGVYGLLTFTANKTVLEKMQERLNYEDTLLRFLITQIES